MVVTKRLCKAFILYLLRNFAEADQGLYTLCNANRPTVSRRLIRHFRNISLRIGEAEAGRLFVPTCKYNSHVAPSTSYRQINLQAAYNTTVPCTILLTICLQRAHPQLKGSGCPDHSQSFQRKVLLSVKSTFNIFINEHIIGQDRHV